jgi:uncharacterized protein (TIGR00255 family)
MTGFGQADAKIEQRQVSVEMKAVNGKQFEINAKLPPILRLYELELRQLLSSILLRGNIDVAIAIRQEGANKPMIINTDLAVFYYKGMKQIAERIGQPEDNILSTLMRMPDVVAPDQDVVSTEEWEKIKSVVEKAANELMKHRKQEGIALYKDISGRIANIGGLLQQVAQYEEERIERVKTRITQWLSTTTESGIVDQNRLEQEMIYYIERMDFSEEKTRLKQHLDYFDTIIAANDIAVGRKLNFIMQEIGREINTLGSKANHASIQQIVINMKDELEKAKEQILNIL